LTKKCIVVKLGSNILINEEGRLNEERINKLAKELADLRHQGNDMILVTSGAIGVGMRKLKLFKNQKSIPLNQAIAAVGQGLLMRAYEDIFARYDQVIAQILLTREDFEARNRYLNARHTISTLLGLGVIPVINENDTVAVEEIKFGDNDNLSALVASLVGADLLINLSDTEGLYTGDPKCDENVSLIAQVDRLTPELEEIAGGAGSEVGSGGMITKLQAARTSTSSGIDMVIANGTKDNVIMRIVEGERIGTLFKSPIDKVESRKRWLFALSLMGKIEVDKGAEEAISKRGKSLLASGIVAVGGTFKVGDAVLLVNKQDRGIARGLINYSSEEIEKIKGHKSSEIEDILGYKYFDEVIHRDNMVLSL